MILGLIPDCDLENVGPIGNAAGTGARIALLDRFKRDEIERVLRRVEKIETALEAKFQDHFVAAMALPHGSDDFAELSKAVSLPERKVVDTQAGGGRTRGRRRAKPRPAAEAE